MLRRIYKQTWLVSLYSIQIIELKLLIDFKDMIELHWIDFRIDRICSSDSNSFARMHHDTNSVRDKRNKW